ncbi:hypothetical protein [Frankia sp. AgKG'84/4]|uniref:hypothetical protein n=1 Tax=Frankia sp. AgKG'84/4 TaxID=573490 RepID=UPI00201076A0|nr:hypothetical protein [Frankia sp. AgKG'84/4]MCL9796290.1 hypothetical protein [Frankia sp. AgKG'84/4]
MSAEPSESRDAHVVLAPHIGPEYDRIIREIRRTVDAAGAHHIEYYDRGLPAVAADVLGIPELAGNVAGSRTVERVRRDFETIGRQLSHRMAELNASLLEIAGGRLIRTVFAAPDRAVLYFDIDEGQYVVGIALTEASVDNADRALSAMSARIRAERGLPDVNFGGFRAAENGTGVDTRPWDEGSEDEDSEDERTSASLPQPSKPLFASPFVDLVHRAWSAQRDHREELFQAQALSVLQPADLHFIALVRGGRTSAADLLDHDSLNAFFVGAGRAARRDALQKVGTEFLALNDLLDGLLRSVLNRRLTRTVLDVEKGALFLHRISREEFLLGATFDQRQVARADQRFQLLVQRFGASGA